jgi:hypothetical protein
MYPFHIHNHEMYERNDFCEYVMFVCLCGGYIVICLKSERLSTRRGGRTPNCPSVALRMSGCFVRKEGDGLENCNNQEVCANDIVFCNGELVRPSKHCIAIGNTFEIGSTLNHPDFGQALVIGDFHRTCNVANFSERETCIEEARPSYSYLYFIYHVCIYIYCNAIFQLKNKGRVGAPQFPKWWHVLVFAFTCWVLRYCL